MNSKHNGIVFVAIVLTAISVTIIVSHYITRTENNQPQAEFLMGNVQIWKNETEIDLSYNQKIKILKQIVIVVCNETLSDSTISNITNNIFSPECMKNLTKLLRDLSNLTNTHIRSDMKFSSFEQISSAISIRIRNSFVVSFVLFYFLLF